MLIFLITFLRQADTILGEPVQHEGFFIDKRSKHLLENLFKYSRFPRWKRMIDSSCGLSFYGSSCLLWLLFPFLEFSVNGKNILNILGTYFRHYIICIATVKLLQPSRFFFEILCQTTIIGFPYFNRYEKVTCDNCANQTTKLILARHMNSCSAGTLHCTQCTNLFTKSQNDLNYHTAKRHSAPKPDVTLKCKLCYEEFPGFYALRQ